MDDMQTIKIPGTGNFQFSATKLDALGATEYTLVTVVMDTSGSVEDFADSLLNCLKSIVGACKKSPRSENLMLRYLTFNENVAEVHGFKPLNDIKVEEYKALKPFGMTALYDATYSAVGAMATYAKNLTDQEFGVNGATYIITDGLNNRGSMGPKQIKEKLKEAVKEEYLESQVTCLIALKDPSVQSGAWLNEVVRELKIFKEQAELTEIVEVGDATPQKLAKLANWVSSSISSQSQAMGTGGPSQPVAF
jgi:uncharacterized protein YegL